MSLHTEINFEQEICDHLAAYGWLYSPDDSGYDRELALYGPDLFDWLAETQAQAWEKLNDWHKADARAQLLKRLATELDTHGPLHVLRNGFKCMPAGALDLCQFRPAHGHNPATQARYAANRVRVMRQVHYSTGCEKSIDLVLLVNGVPLATIELKTDFTQTLDDAKRQYRQDRPPREPASNRLEPLLDFNRRALVHFAVSTDEVAMATKLTGSKTRFLPFNRGYKLGAGNPPDEARGYRTAYLWEEVLQRDVWLQILGSFMLLEKVRKTDAKGVEKIHKTLIFPRYHQWQAVNALVAAAREEGPGQTYLVQHSAGSGKTNSISWLAHRLATLHGDDDTRAFHGVIVITDRTVLDNQLQDAVRQIEHRDGMVAAITSKEGSKSASLAEALAESVPIIVVTLQTFPFVMKAIAGEDMSQRRFAVIADEAHSSQTGQAALKLKAALMADGVATADGDDGSDDDEAAGTTIEDALLARAAARPLPPNVSFFAFTATPKAKTLEMFGRRPDPTRPAAADNKPQPFDLYSMQQAIEEKFILDVLRNYTPYKLAYKLAHQGIEIDHAEVDKSEGMKQLVRWVRLHPHNIGQKVQIIIEHFRQNVRRRLDGQAKAMVVTGSRLEAVRYKLAMDKYLHEQGYTDVVTLVAFSGDVIDPDTGPEKFNEHGMNPGLKGRDIPEALDSDDFRVLIVANKYQTGFDAPKLMAMYVDKKLAGVSAVQTLSRLNRKAPGKDQTFVLDFVNDPEDIREAFEPYYRVSELADITDPNLIYDLQTGLDQALIYTNAEVEGFIAAELRRGGKQADLHRWVNPAQDRFKGRMKAAKEKIAKNPMDTEDLEALELFKRNMGSFLRVYDFLSQIINYGDPSLESRYWYFKHLLPKLREEGEDETIDLAGLQMTHYQARLGMTADIALGVSEDEGDYQLKPLTEVGSGRARDDQRIQLAMLVQKINDLFEGMVGDRDAIALVEHAGAKIVENHDLAQQAANNSKQQFALGSFNAVVKDTVIDSLDQYQDMATQFLGNPRIQKRFNELMLDYLYDALRERGRASPQSPPSA